MPCQVKGMSTMIVFFVQSCLGKLSLLSIIYMIKMYNFNTIFYTKFQHFFYLKKVLGDS